MDSTTPPASKLKVINKPIESLLPYARNAKIHDQENVKQIAASIMEFGFCNPVLIDAKGEIIAGHGRVLACELLGIKEVPCIVLGHLNEGQKKAYRLADNRLVEKSTWDLDILAEELEQLATANYDLLLTGFDGEEIEALLKNSPLLLGNEHWAKRSVIPENETNYDRYKVKNNPGSLFRQFGVPPFSVLNTQSKYWRERKDEWKQRIGEKGQTRESTLSGTNNAMESINGGASILDPVLCELLCKWFALPGYRAFNPFAGGPMFGFVAASEGLNFTGIELRGEQAKVSNKCFKANSLKANTHNDDAKNMAKYIKPGTQDFIFTCPPYLDLEKYSDLPNDLSNMSIEDFFEVYGECLTGTYALLKNNRFAVVVVSEVRDKEGIFVGLVPKTIEIMEAAGYKYYNEIVLLNAVGTLAIRIARHFNAGRKIGRMHQNVLVFYKGNPSQIKETFGPVINEEELEAEEETTE